MVQKTFHSPYIMVAHGHLQRGPIQPRFGCPIDFCPFLENEADSFYTSKPTRLVKRSISTVREVVDTTHPEICHICTELNKQFENFDMHLFPENTPAAAKNPYMRTCSAPGTNIAYIPTVIRIQATSK